MDAKRVAVRIRAEIVLDVLARAGGDLEIAVAMKMFVAIKKGMSDQRSPHYRRDILRYIRTARLVIEMIAPARPAIARRLIFNEPLQRGLRPLAPHTIAVSLVQTDETARQKTHSLGGTALGYSQQWAQINRKAPHSLLQHRAQ